MTIASRIERCGIVPVVVLNEVSRAVDTARALLSGGIDVIEITFRTAAAAESIAAVSAALPEMLVGAGTVINTAQLDEAIAAGAKFIVSPGSDEVLIAAAMERGIPIFPGVVTPGEIMMGLRHGIEIFKFFPAESFGGLKTIAALCAPFPGIRFVPTGGISEKNAADYFANKRIAAVGGSWMVSADMIGSGDYEGITRKSAEAVEICRQARGQ